MSRTIIMMSVVIIIENRPLFLLKILDRVFGTGTSIVLYSIFIYLF
jgi:hypothetical protein